MQYSSRPDHRFNVRDMIERMMLQKGMREAIEGLSDLEAVRRLQEWEGFTPCFGREIALRPAPHGRCSVLECCWKNFCAPYRQTSVPIDSVITSVSKLKLDSYVDFLLSRRSGLISNSGLSVTFGGRVQLEQLSRKLLIGSPRSVLSESIKSSELRPIQLTFSAKEFSAGRGQQSPNTRNFDLSRNILWTSDPWRIFNWYNETQSFIDQSILDFDPHVIAQSDRISVWKTEQPEFSTLAQPEFKLLNTPHIASADQEISVSDPHFVPLLNLEIPFIESASLGSIQRLMEDFPDELTSFRNYLLSSIDSIRDRKLESETFVADVQKIERSINSSLRELSSQIKHHKLKHYVQLGGGAIAAFTLSVYCLLKDTSGTLSVVGPGGFAFVLAGRITDYVSSRVSLSDNPIHFLWRIGQSKRP